MPRFIVLSISPLNLPLLLCSFLHTAKQKMSIFVCIVGMGGAIVGMGAVECARASFTHTTMSNNSIWINICWCRCCCSNAVLLVWVPVNVNEITRFHHYNNLTIDVANVLNQSAKATNLFYCLKQSNATHVYTKHLSMCVWTNHYHHALIPLHLNLN